MGCGRHARTRRTHITCPCVPPPLPCSDRPRDCTTTTPRTVDDLRPQLGETYGAGTPYIAQTHTPVMDQLGRDGLVFDLAYAQIPHCSPSRNSLLSGLRPNTIQTWNFFGTPCLYFYVSVWLSACLCECVCVCVCVCVCAYTYALTTAPLQGTTARAL